MLMVIHKNFKCEDCDGDKFTMKDKFDMGVDEIRLHCATKGCEASYTFRPTMKFSSSSHEPKRCSCGRGLLSRTDKYCSCCGKKNPNSMWIKKKKSKIKISGSFKKKHKIKENGKKEI